MATDAYETRAGFKYVYTLQPGEDWCVVPGGICVTHPDRLPKIVYRDSGQIVELRLDPLTDRVTVS